MTDVVIKAENLGKRYTIGHQAGRGDQTTFREVLVQNARNLWNKSRDLIAGKPVIAGDMQEEVWALKDVSFEIKRSEAVGIIGRNGAGKSTLLKILSRITEPTEGRVTIRGRVASLLEVGTGFHPELSGRENIYLNGTMLGMTRTEIKQKFEEIVAFSEVEKYLDTPVKRYSSGMYVRLAFAVAAHLEPEILMVDEVLAVGDIAFQRKCLGKMEEVSQGGRTVLMVSHNLAAVEGLCTKALLLDKSKIVMYSDVSSVITQYIADVPNVSGHFEFDDKVRKGTGEILFKTMEILSNHLPSMGVVPMGGILSFKLTLEKQIRFSSFSGIDVRIGVYDDRSRPVCHLSSLNAGINLHHSKMPERFIVICTIPYVALVPGQYHVNLAVVDSLGGSILDYLIQVGSFHVESADVFGTGRVPNSAGGVCFFKTDWYLESAP